MVTGHRVRSKLLALAAILSTLLTCGCASLQERTPYTSRDAMVAQPAGYDNVRAWLDADVQYPRDFAPSTANGQAATYLALSGGGGDGAYGAGILNGWTKSGTRPVFTAVSGVSTGALIAPFAFLGPAYDGKLRDIYTDGEAGALLKSPDFLEGAFGSSLFGSNRLLTLVSRYLDADMVAAIAKEHRDGRRLYVVTTNVDSKRGVVWNIGAIAASGRPDALDLIRKVLAASASVPLVFSPVLIDAQANGQSFQEMHVDGNVTTAVFTLPLQYLAAQNRTRLSGGKIFVLMNTSVEPKFALVPDSTLRIVGASIGTLTTQKTLEDLATIYAYSKANKVDFNITSIPASEDAGGVQSFEDQYMRKIYAVGYEKASAGAFWRKSPIAGSSEKMAVVVR